MGKIYVGTGNPVCSAAITKILTTSAKVLGRNGYTLRSGGTKGADTAFEEGCDLVEGKKEIYLPEKDYNGNTSELFDLDNFEEAEKIAKKYHKSWSLLSKKNKGIIARLSYLVLGRDLNTPADFVIAYSTGANSCSHVISMAKTLGIKVYNLGNSYEYNPENRKTFVKQLKAELGLESLKKEA